MKDSNGEAVIDQYLTTFQEKGKTGEMEKRIFFSSCYSSFLS
jgi:hypothetical protein